jgi:hypothetical protein
MPAVVWDAGVLVLIVNFSLNKGKEKRRGRKSRERRRAGNMFNIG